MKIWLTTVCLYVKLSMRDIYLYVEKQTIICGIKRVEKSYINHTPLFTATKFNTKPFSCQNQKWLVFATSIDPGQPAHLCSPTRLYTVGWPTSSYHLDIPKMIMDNTKNGRWINPFKKFGRLRVNNDKHLKYQYLKYKFIICTCFNQSLIICYLFFLYQYFARRLKTKKPKLIS